jgi:hypothetical protein
LIQIVKRKFIIAPSTFRVLVTLKFEWTKLLNIKYLISGAMENLNLGYEFAKAIQMLFTRLDHFCIFLNYNNSKYFRFKMNFGIKKEKVKLDDLG